MDDDGETIAVLGAGRIAALNTTALAWQAEVRHRVKLKTSASVVHAQVWVCLHHRRVKVRGIYSGLESIHRKPSGLCVSLPQEPPEDEANIIEKIISVRTKNKEVKANASISYLYAYPWSISITNALNRARFMHSLTQVVPRLAASTQVYQLCCDFSSIVQSYNTF